MKLNIFVQTYTNKRNVVQMMTAAIQVISYLNEIISLNQLRSNSYSRRKIRRLAICESFIYLKFPPNLLFKSRSHLNTVLVYNKNVFFSNSFTYLVSYTLYNFISRTQRTPVTSHHFFTVLVS